MSNHKLMHFLDAIVDFTLIQKIGDMPKNELCSECYVNRLKMMQSSPYSIYRTQSFYQGALKRAVDVCSLSDQPVSPQPPVIPVKPPQETWCISGKTYKTADNDTCDSIAEEFSVSSASLFIGNSEIRDCSSIPTGSKLCLPLQCQVYKAIPRATCVDVFAATGIRVSKIQKYNPWISNDCRNLPSASRTYGNVLCLAPVGGFFNGTTNATSTGSYSSEYVQNRLTPPPNTKVANSTTLHCGRWHTAMRTDNCASITKQFISSHLFRAVNPSLKGGDCSSKLVEGSSYCTGPMPTWSSYTRNSSDIVSYGCFKSISKKLVLTGSYITNENITRVENCGNYCTQKRYLYWGLQEGSTCSCGYELALNSTKLEDFQCSTKCVGGGELPCGGKEAVNVYGFQQTLLRAYTGIGCFTDTNSTHALDATPYEDDNMTKTKCANHCLEKHYTYFGTSRGKECYCGNTISSDSKKVDAKECNLKCPGNIVDTCGQAERINVYGTVVKSS